MLIWMYIIPIGLYECFTNTGIDLTSFSLLLKIEKLEERKEAELQTLSILNYPKLKSQKIGKINETMTV